MPMDLSCTICKGSGEVEHSTSQEGRILSWDVKCPDCGGAGIAAWAVEAAKDVDLFDGVARYRERTIAEIVVDVLVAVREEGAKRDNQY